MSAVALDQLRECIGRTDTRSDVISIAPVAALSACLGYERTRARAGDPLPTGWHWLFFQDVIPTANLAVDGHAQRGGFLPPVPLPRRMWAGSRLRCVAPLIVGSGVSRVSTIQSVEQKRGRNGDLVFVTVLQQIYCQDSVLLEEEQDLVYREKSSGSARSNPATLSPVAQWCEEVCPDSVLLFRYSALTFNSHRIHYDRDYAMHVEGYDGLVVQGPLTATLLLELLHRELPSAHIASFRFRAVRPLLADAILHLQGRRDEQEVRLWALDAKGDLAMEAWASLARDAP